MSKTKSNAHSSEDFSSSSGSSSSISSDEEVDARDLKPIREYLSDRRELARQLFKSVKTEKIQMMLPQALKRMDFGQLESCCANELSGMSRSRILSILDGKPMLESSATSESDDSGPSLEIISDTEEWFSDEDTIKKEDGSKGVKGKAKKERIKQKGKPQLTKKNDKSAHKKVDSDCKNVQVKVEKDVVKNKEKEGDSLLDLLELEMRARAIRALIRKEEDIIPNSSKSTKGAETSKKNAAAVAKAEQEELKEKENCRRQLERIIGAQQTSAAEDEDVVLVVQPTPTIELISSESEGESHGGVRVNKKLQNERVMEMESTGDHNQNRDSNSVHNVNNAENSEKNEIAENAVDAHKEDVSHKSELTKRIHSNNESTDNQLKPSSKRRKVKKKSRAKDQSRNTTSEIDVKNGKADDSATQNSKINDRNGNLNNQDSSKESSAASNIALDEEKSIDMDEIIDLDNYCDDMDDLENTETDKKNQTVENKQSESETRTNSLHKSNGTETWASRYYQTDDVQNVIKESKIQSEIRKRLRERQRLSKLSISPNKNSSSSPDLAETKNKPIEKDPLGSVNEYLALKQITAVNSNAFNSNNDSTENSTESADVRTDDNKVIENDLVSGILPGNQKANLLNATAAQSEDVTNVTNPD